ncbi:DUF1294 domain-containing protein [Dechloromonas sp. A34]|uniref:DUF1294 domain-containing protein n=1 Tax=Dechloromonas sp. A34 TaxID=447588 RepID=UPI002248E16B|nr:DUF1294 domain-containing protein [Dechloromonas sp. A34]
MRHQGKITTWKDDQGFGFITPNLGGPEIFAHIRSFAKRQRRPEAGQIVTYEQVRDARGRLQATQIDFVGSPQKMRAAKANGSSRLPLAIAGIFLAFVAVSALTGKLPLAVLGLYVGASLAAFIAYAADKSAARNDRWRTKENTLHLLALIGGWPGALVAQNRLRHKSSKMSFQVVFWATVLLNCGALALLSRPAGASALKALLGVT